MEYEGNTTHHFVSKIIIFLACVKTTVDLWKKKKKL